MTAGGDVYGRTGYQGMKPAAYVEHVAELRKDRSVLMKSREIIAGFAKATGDAKVGLLEKAIALLSALQPDSGISTKDKLAEVVMWAFEADPRNERGLKKSALVVLLDAGVAHEKVVEEGRAFDPDNKAAILEKVVLVQCTMVKDETELTELVADIDKLDQSGIHDKEVAFSLYFNSAYWRATFLDEEDKAKAHARKALELGSENERAVAYLEQLVG